MRAQHYLFAHHVLPGHLWQGDSVLGILANPENQSFLTDLWDGIPRTTAFIEHVRAHKEKLDDPEELEFYEEFGHELADIKTYAQRLPSAALRYTSHWLGQQHLVFLIRLPVAEWMTEAHFIAITTSPAIRYFTLEYTLNDDRAPSTTLCEWDADGDHVNYGDGPEPSEIRFLEALCEHLDIPAVIEPPTYQQMQGMSQGGTTMYMGGADELDEDDAVLVAQWELAAEEAFDEDNHEREEELYRQIYALRMERQGPDSTDATLVLANLASSLSYQQRHDDAEEVCWEWWRLCRRYRMLGHAETMSATRMLAETFEEQGRMEEKEWLMRYRAFMAGLARGVDSVEAEMAREELAISLR